MCSLIDTQANASHAAKLVKIQYSSKGKPILTIADALEANSVYDYPGEGNILMAGDAKGMLYVHICSVSKPVCMFIYTLYIRTDVRTYTV